MAISYPRDLPTNIGFAQVTLRAVNQTAMTMSPFTYKQQIYNHSGQRWEAECQVPPLKRDDAEEWIAWLLSLNGRAGTFLMGDPLGDTARGTLGGTPVVNGADQVGNSLTIDGCSNSITNWIKAGDYVQLGSGSTATLHKILQSVNTNASGQATLDIWPSMRTAPADGSTIVTSNAVGRFRLNSGQQDWTINNISSYGITFAAVEAIT
jgi:hypothetical protein